MSDRNSDGASDKALEVDTQERIDQKNTHLDEQPEEEIEKERQERLDPDNRPDNVEVDNTQRDFDPRTGTFEDSDVEPAGDFADEGAGG